MLISLRAEGGKVDNVKLDIAILTILPALLTFR